MTTNVLHNSQEDAHITAFFFYVYKRRDIKQVTNIPRVLYVTSNPRRGSPNRHRGGQPKKKSAKPQERKAQLYEL